MKFQQLRYLCEVARHGLSFSGAAKALHTSQPGISKQIRLLEEELGVDLFIRNGNRVAEMTEPARRIVAIASNIMREIDDVRSVAREFKEGNEGPLALAATFVFARYLIPDALQHFLLDHPKVEINLLQDGPAQVSRLAASGAADLAITTRPAEPFPDLIFLEFCELPRVLVLPKGHPLLRKKPVTLEAIAGYPLVTLDLGSHGQQRMRERFARGGLSPHIVFSGMDVDVVKAMIEGGLGIAVLPRLAFDAKRDINLRAIDVSHLFESHSGCLAIRKNHYLRGYAFEFIATLAPTLHRRKIETALEAARATRL